MEGRPPRSRRWGSRRPLVAGGRLGELTGRVVGAEDPPARRHPDAFDAIGASPCCRSSSIDRLGCWGAVPPIRRAPRPVTHRRDELAAAAGTPPTAAGGGPDRRPDGADHLRRRRHRCRRRHPVEDQVNENAKAPAFAHSTPSCATTRSAGGVSGDVTRRSSPWSSSATTTSTPRCQADRHQRRLVGEVVADVVEVRAQGDGPARPAARPGPRRRPGVAAPGLRGHDPGPIRVLEFVKQQLRG